MEQFSFPKQEPEFRTRITFRKYSRPKPGSQPSLTGDAVIWLPLPANLTDSFNMQINEERFDLLGTEVGVGEMLSAGYSNVADFVSNLRFSLDSVNDAVKKILRAGALTPGLSDIKPGQRLQSEFGVVRNPHLTSIFEGVRLKTYAFSWKLAPKSQDEAIELERIINKIKWFMHPDISPTGFALEYPHLASIKFEVGDSQTLPNVRDSFITRMDVNNNGSGVPAFFKDGRPVSVELTLAFQEVFIQTRRDFASQWASGGGGSAP